ncbi:MAG: helix-turn-helix domain-containing protein, partial [Akkermansiaceae bacterium]
MIATSNKTKQGKRVSYSFAEVAAMVGIDRTWIYRQVKKGRIRAIT